MLRTLALQFGMNYDRDVEMNVSRMQPSAENGNLAIVSIQGKLDSKTIDKGMAAERLSGTWSFAADGFGDSPLAKVVKNRKGLVIGIEGNLDMIDLSEFLRLSDVVVRNPQEFTESLRQTISILSSQ